MISTPLRMEKPVRRPMVPPIKPSCASIVTLTNIICLKSILHVQKASSDTQTKDISIGDSAMSPFHPSQSHHRSPCQSRCALPPVEHEPKWQLKTTKRVIKSALTLACFFWIEGQAPYIFLLVIVIQIRHCLYVNFLIFDPIGKDCSTAFLSSAPLLQT